jgi:hypothetical protein
MIKCTICPILWDNIKKYLTDTTKIFGKDFVKQNYHKHIGYSFVLTIPTIMFLMYYAHLADTGLFFQTSVGGFGAYGVNFVREWYYGIKYKAPFDFTDLNMGSYGGILGALVSVLIYSIL